MAFSMASPHDPTHPHPPAQAAAPARPAADPLLQSGLGRLAAVGLACALMWAVLAWAMGAA